MILSVIVLVHNVSMYDGIQNFEMVCVHEAIITPYTCMSLSIFSLVTLCQITNQMEGSMKKYVEGIMKYNQTIHLSFLCSNISHTKNIVNVRERNHVCMYMYFFNLRSKHMGMANM